MKQMFTLTLCLNSIILFLILSSPAAFSQTKLETINKANDLIANKKYASAFNLLDAFDPTNDNADVVLLKEKIMLNYFVTSLMHQIFALKDLEKNEDIMDYRGREGSFEMHSFQVDSILTKLINIYPTNCKLYKGLADYYYDAHLKYGERWLIDDNDLLPLIQINYQKAIEGNCADYQSYYVLGYLNLIREKINESIPYFQKSIELNHSYASSHYNLAYAYFYTDDRENALKFAKNALDLYEDKDYKSDAARMVAQIFIELNDNKNAIRYYEMADNINPGNYYTIKPILNLYIKTNNKNVRETTIAFFNLAPENPIIYNDLDEIYSNNEKNNELIEFYKSQLSAFNHNLKVQGNLNFYLARIYLNKDKKTAYYYFLKAKEVFEKTYDQGHAVFNAIDEGLTQCKN